MARDKYIDTQPTLISVDLAARLLPGSFEHALNHSLDHAVDLSHFDTRFRNDVTGAPAYPPALLLQVVLVAYSQGIVSSRQIVRDREGFRSQRRIAERSHTARQFFRRPQRVPEFVANHARDGRNLLWRHVALLALGVTPTVFGTVCRRHQ